MPPTETLGPKLAGWLGLVVCLVLLVVAGLRDTRVPSRWRRVAWAIVGTILFGIATWLAIQVVGFGGDGAAPRPPGL